MDQVKYVEDSLKEILCLSRPYLFKSFKKCHAQILLGPFLNTVPNICLNLLAI